MIDKQAVLERINYKSFYTQYIPSLKINGKSEALGLCLFHNDRTPSLSVNVETGLYNCFACGAKGDVFKFYQDYKKVDFKTALREIGESQGIAETSKGKVVATFEYKDAEGKILYIKERTEPGRGGRKKEFRFKHLVDESNQWQMGRGGDSVPYNLPLLVKSKYVFICEGEAKADLLVKQFGLTATCLDAGAQSPFRDDYLKYFEGIEKVFILPDNDAPGKQYADKIASTLYGKIKKIKVIELPGLQQAEDIIDWAKAAGNDKEKLLSLVKEAPEWKVEEKAEQTTEAPDNIEIVRLDSVTAEKVDWLWPGYIPLGKLTLIDGDPGLGKSLFSVDLASRLTTGQPMPDGTPSIQGGVVLMSLEDGLADTIVPRLNVAGADKTKIIALEGIKDVDGQYRFPTVEDVGAIRQACERVNAKLLVIDPLMGYLGGKINSHKDQDVRRALSPLAKMANEAGIAIIIIRHLIKSESSNSVYRGGGSIGIIGAARSALLVAKDPENENRRILAGIKSNLAPLPPSLSYTIENIDGIPKIVWGGVTNHTADALLAVPSNPEERSALEDAKDFLRDLLASGAVEARDIQREAKQAGISDMTLRRARQSLSVSVKKEGYQGKWVWILKDVQDSPKVFTKNNEHLWEGLNTFDNSAPSQDCQDMPKVAKENLGNLKGSLATLGDSVPPEGEVIDLTDADFEVI